MLFMRLALVRSITTKTRRRLVFIYKVDANNGFQEQASFSTSIGAHSKISILQPPC